MLFFSKKWLIGDYITEREKYFEGCKSRTTSWILTKYSKKNPTDSTLKAISYAGLVEKTLNLILSLMPMSLWNCFSLMAVISLLAIGYYLDIAA